MQLLVYNIKGNVSFIKKVKKPHAVAQIHRKPIQYSISANELKNEQLPEWDLLLNHNTKAMKQALLKNISHKCNCNTFR